MKRLGIIGGLGPETSCKFCLNINNRFREKMRCQPDIVLENLPISAKAEVQIINGDLGDEHLELLKQAIKRLNHTEADFIVIPCNTVHVFIEDLRKLSKKPILSIIEETIKKCREKSIKKIGLLASTKTVQAGLYEKELKKLRIGLILPNQKDQKEISEIIVKIIHNETNSKDKQFLLWVIKKLKNSGAEAVVIGCTDLPLLLNQDDSCLPIFDTLTVLEDAVIHNLLNKD